jgi:diguanylate cyclase (GGDEF)-like protein
MAFADVVRSQVRDVDTVGRLGGDEFGLVLPDADLVSATAVLERVRTALTDAPSLLGGHEVPMTLSAGVTDAGRDGDTVDVLLARADSALYVAKEQGRNRVVTT